MHPLKTILPLLLSIAAACSRNASIEEPFTTVSLSVSAGAELSVKGGIIYEESALNEIVFAAFSSADGKCIWSGQGNNAMFTCRMGTPLRIVALCNYHGLVTMPSTGGSVDIIDNQTIDWDDINLSIKSNNDIPMFGEVSYTPYGEQADVVVNVKRICNKMLISGEVSASGDVSAEGVDFDGADRLSALIIHSSSTIHLDGRPDEDSDESSDLMLCQDLKNELEDAGYAGAYYPSGLECQLVLQFEHSGKVWHYPVSIGCGLANNEFRMNDVIIGKFIDWDEQWCREKFGIVISEWSGNHTINETI